VNLSCVCLAATRYLISQSLADQLQHTVEPDYGLLDHIVSRRILTLDAVEEIRSHIAATRRSRLLLDHFVEESDNKKVDKFIEALRDTDQQHVVNAIHHNGGECCYIRLNYKP
jgi:Caspase recruitment domain